MLQPMQLLQRWLSRLQVPVSRKYLQQQLLSHPDYPSLLSITDTLDALGVENAALVVDKDRLNDIPLPFLAHTPAQGFLLVENVPSLLRTDPSFLQNWNGVVVAAEKPSVTALNSQHKEWLLWERKYRKSLWISAVTLVAFLIITLVTAFSPVNAALLLTALAGTGVAVLIVQQELGFTNPITAQLCAASKQTDCNAVIQSKGASLPGGLKWADIGIIYFPSTTLLLLIANLTGQVQSVINLMSLVAVASLPFTFFSLYYQWRIVKKWCVLCLVVVVVLWTQLSVLVPVLLQFNVSAISINTTLLYAFAGFVVSGIWLLLIKPLLHERKDLEENQWRLQQFKRNPNLFTALLAKQRKVNITPFTHDLQIANANAAFQIVIACNPYCGPCAKAHAILHELAERHEYDLGITIRFACKVENKEDKRTQVVQHILRYARQHARGEGGNKMIRNVLHDWFLDMDYEKFRKQYPVDDNMNVRNWLADHEAWCNESNIAFTPTVFINGLELSKPYVLSDILLLMQGLKENSPAIVIQASKEEVCT